MTAAALPAAGLRPATLVLLDPPAIPLRVDRARWLDDPSEQPYDDLDDGRSRPSAAATRPGRRDVRAKAEALTQLDEAAARAVLLDNGDWDGGLADLADPAAAGIPSGSSAATRRPAATSRTPCCRRSRRGSARTTSSRSPGAPHSPQRTHPVETTAALLRAPSSAEPAQPRPGAGSRPPAGTPRRTAAPSPSPSRSRPPSRDRAGPPTAAPPRRAQRDRRLARRDQRRRRVARVEHEPGPRARVRRLVDDRVGQAAGPVDDRRRPVAQRDHLALPARLEPRRHREEVGAGVDPAGHRPVEPLDERDPVAGAPRRAPGTARPAPGRRCPGRRAGRRASSSAGAASASRSKPFCGSSRPIIPMTGAVVGRVEPEPRQQVGPAGRLAGPVGRASTARRGPRRSPGPRPSCRAR